MLKQKIGQMLMIGFEGTTLTPNDAIVHAIQQHAIGGVILFDHNFQHPEQTRNIENPTQLRQLTHQLQHYTQQTDAPPLFIGIDYEGGKVNRLKEKYGFPATLSAADIGKLSLRDARAHADQMAQTLQNAGINLNFAPVIDINVNPDNPVIGKLDRSFSNDPATVSQYAEIFSACFKAHHILCSYKHFPGHGSSTGDTHAGFVDVTQTWQADELDPYRTLLPKADACQLVMLAHVVNKHLDPAGYPASLSYAITTKLLRHDLHFTGVTVSDDMQMKAITDQYGLTDALPLAINAGADILVFGNQLVAEPQDPKILVDMIYADVQAGKISAARIDDAYAHIMQLKTRLSVVTPA